MEFGTVLKFVSAVKAYPLRLAVLKPANEEYEYDYVGDDLSTTYHMALFVEGEMVCVASFFEKSSLQANAVLSVQLRGMATSEDFQGKGLGFQLVKHAIDEAINRGYKTMWCNARLNAISFYEKLGFEVKSEEFLVPHVGLHCVMAIVI